MSNQLDRKQEIKAETKKFKTLSFFEKITYIKDYYWMPIAAVILLIIVGYALYRTYQSKNFETKLYIALANNSKSVWAEDIDQYERALSDRFAESIGIDNQKQRIMVDNSYVFNVKKDAEMSLLSAESLLAMYYGGKVDVLVGDQEAIEYFYADEGTYYHDLRQIFDEEFLKKYDDKIVYYTGMSGSKTPIAFDISDCKTVKDGGLTIEPAYIAIYYTTTRLDTAVEYVHFLLENR